MPPVVLMWFHGTIHVDATNNLACKLLYVWNKSDSKKGYDHAMLLNICSCWFFFF
jgi:hypothetical protein